MEKMFCHASYAVLYYNTLYCHSTLTPNKTPIISQHIFFGGEGGWYASCTTGCRGYSGYNMMYCIYMIKN